ncbi:unnamed protein product [Lactuca saligna]|uniref:Uncharacterized protein n=1 Tax=Lactuca saligna TaxID=75948 RepID=A0AA35Z341_LACSI|nr:unnamed protein product [Lactuca saligna]
MEAKAATKQAQKDGAKAAKMATRKAKRIIGMVISSGWDFFEAIYCGGIMTEGFLRGTGTLFGTYIVGYLGEERIGFMVYDIANGLYLLLGFGQFEENVCIILIQHDMEVTIVVAISSSNQMNHTLNNSQICQVKCMFSLVKHMFTQQDPIKVQTSGGYPTANYNAQKSSRSQGRHPGYAHQYLNYTTDSNVAIRNLVILTTTTLAKSMVAKQGPIVMATHEICLQVWLAVSLITDALAASGKVLIASSVS